MNSGNPHHHHGLSTRKRPRSVEAVTALTLFHRQELRLQPQATRTNAGTASSTSSPALLQHPQWRLHPGTITELAGPAGVGKTQLALTLCADSVLLQQTAMYISLGGSSEAGQKHMARRLQGMLSARHEFHQHDQNHHNMNKNDDDDHDDDDPSNNNQNVTNRNAKATSHRREENMRMIRDRYLRHVLFHSVRNTEEFMDLIQGGLSKLLADRRQQQQQGQPLSHPQQHSNHREIRIIILDGIANLFRHAEYDLSSTTTTTIYDWNYWHQRSTTFFRISTILKNLSEEYQIPFVIINQATTKFSDSSTSPGGDHHHHNDNDTTTTSRLEPALGLSWRQCINASFFIENTNTMVRLSHHPKHHPHQNHSSSSPSLARKRRIHCLKSSRISNNDDDFLEFYIDQRGTVRLTTGEGSSSTSS